MLPEEILEEEILWRLPVKSIIRCGCVCKSWYSLIRSRYFISTHFHKTKNTQPFVHQFGDRSSSLSHNSQISLVFYNPDHKLDYMLLNLPTDPFLTFLILGSRNGILCLVDQQHGSNLILLNPSIRHSLLLPVPQFLTLSQEIGLLGFGFDCINRDYKIIRIAKSRNRWIAELYSLNSNFWRQIRAPIRKFNYCMPRNNLAIFANGRLHWLVHDAFQNTNLILSFDLKDETFHHLTLPEYVVNSQLQCINIIEFRESSIVLIYDEQRLGGAPALSWVMREYGAAADESWQSISMDEVDQTYLGCQPKDVNKEFLEIIQSSKSSSHLYVPSLELLDRQGYWHGSYKNWINCSH